MSASKGDPDATTDERSTDAGAAEATPTEGDPVSDREDDLPLDVVFDILKNRRRRLVLEYLLEVSEISSLSDLAEHIAAVENDKPEGAITSSERKRVYVCLYQCHLPRMDDAGVIDFENDRGTVELADDVDQLTRYLDTTEDDSGSEWPKYYAALTAIGGGLFVAQRLILPSEVLSGVIMGFLLGLFANLALEHAYKRGLLLPRTTRRPSGGAVDAN